MAAVAYRFGAADLCAAGVAAPHIRPRLFWMADNARVGRRQRRAQRRGSVSGIYAEKMRVRPLHGGESRRLVQSDGEGFSAGEPTASPLGHGHSIVATSPDGGLGNSASYNKRRDSLPRKNGKGIKARRSSGVSGLAHSALPESSRFRQQREQLLGQAAWSRFDIVPCQDGWARRIESGTFPLAHGVPGRVGLLRGYGNAIVPQVAAEFIQAYCEPLT